VFTFVIRDLGGCWKGQEVGPIIDGMLHPIIDGVFHPRSSAPHLMARSVSRPPVSDDLYDECCDV